MKKSAMITNKESAFLAEAICADRKLKFILPTQGVYHEKK